MLRLGINNLSIGDGAIGSGFSIASLFAAGEQGAWYDPSDLTTVFQDVAGTIPATAGTQVALIKDKSGRGNDASQATAAARPFLRNVGTTWYLEFDGVDDWMSTATFDLNSDAAYVSLAIRKLDEAASRFILETSPNSSTASGVILINGPSSANLNNYGVRCKGTAGSFVSTPAGTSPSPITNILGVYATISGSSVSDRIDGSVLASSGASIGTGLFGNFPMFLFARGGVGGFFPGYLYGLVLRGAATGTDQMLAVETMQAQKAGISLVTS
jgi:hypothetical protein